MLRDLEPNLSRLALGCYPIGGGYGDVADLQAAETVDAALECGWSFFDTAEGYGSSEERLGRLLSGRRERVFLATKAFPCETYTYEHLERALENSLRRLRTNYVDLYQLHGPEDWVAPFGPTDPAEICAALRRLQESGKVRHIGVCNLPVETLEVLTRHIELFATQNMYSLIDRGDEPDRLHLAIEGRIMPFALERGMAFLAYSPLSRGLLAESLDRTRTFDTTDERRVLPRFQPGVYEHYVDLAGKLTEWAHGHGITTTRLAVAWTLHHPAVTSTLIGAKTAAQVHEIAGAEEIVLSETDLREIDDIVSALHPTAKAAKMTVLDHVSREVLDGMCADRRQAHVNLST